jgi:hypothetical protein
MAALPRGLRAIGAPPHLRYHAQTRQQRPSRDLSAADTRMFSATRSAHGVAPPAGCSSTSWDKLLRTFRRCQRRRPQSCTAMLRAKRLYGRRARDTIEERVLRVVVAIAGGVARRDQMIDERDIFRVEAVVEGSPVFLPLL